MSDRKPVTLIIGAGEGNGRPVLEQLAQAGTVVIVAAPNAETNRII